MADKHAGHGHSGGAQAPAGGGWAPTFIFSIGLFLSVYLLTLFVGHTLAGGH
ncbi:MAG: hypothetical protein ACHQ6T_04180 [Myxococcota bacterium]